MARRLEPINAIAYAQFCLRGGTKQTAGLMLAVLLTFGVIALLTFGYGTETPAAVARTYLGFLLAAQVLLLSALGTQRVNAAVRQDVAGGLIESHRLTPTPPLAAVLGYVLGAPVQAIALGVVVFVCGLAMTVVAHAPVQHWLVANFVAVAAALLLWSFTVLASFMINQAGVVPLIGLLLLPGIALVPVVPALNVLAAPLSGPAMWQPRASGLLPAAYVLSLAGDALFAGVFLLAAARKYRSASNDAFDLRLALLVLVVWTAVSAIGLGRPGLFAGVRPRAADPSVRTLAALISSTMIALLPTAAAARASVVPLDMFVARRPPWWRGVAWLAVPLCVALVTSVTLLAPASPDLWQRQLASLAAVGVLLVAVALLAAWADLIGRSGWPGVIFWLLLTNGLPLLGQAIDDGLSTAPAEQRSVLLLSPIGTLDTLWDGGLPTPPRLWAAVGVQALLLTLPAALFAARLARVRRRAGATPPRSSPPPLRSH